MKSIREVYKIGKGPSSSHTMGPEKAAKLLRQENPQADHFRVILYGSLSKTGRGHGTDTVVIETLAPIPTDVIFSDAVDGFTHPNTMDLFAYHDHKEMAHLRVLSIGGGDIAVEGRPGLSPPEIYHEKTLAEILTICHAKRLRLSDYVFEHEDPSFPSFLLEVWSAMSAAIEAGLTTQGELPGGLHVERKAQLLYNQRHIDEAPTTRENRLICAYAFAVSEQNAAQGTVVTAPTCGACGVLPAVLRYAQQSRGFGHREIIRALAVAGLIGNLVKQNASISGAECGCQAEIGTACSMAAAALAELYEMGLDQIEYAAEVALEHHLGLTCDPIGGLVQIPCIERNAVAAIRAMDALRLANFLAQTRKISFDLVVQTMYETGVHLAAAYRETSEGGLAKLYRR